MGVGVHPGGLRSHALHFEPPGVSVLRGGFGRSHSVLQLPVPPSEGVELEAEAASDKKHQQADEDEADEAGHQSCCPFRKDRHRASPALLA